MSHSRAPEQLPPFLKGGRGDFWKGGADDTLPNPPRLSFAKGGSFNRRAFLASLPALLGAPAWARAAAGPSGTEGVLLAAAWQAGHGYQVGILEHGDGLAVRAALDVPTRAHALLREPGGTLLAVARRPGDWLLRWDQDGRALAWRWIEPRRAFTGHVVSDGRTIYISETDLDTGAGLVGVRDARTLEKRAEWPTRGVDPHQLVLDAEGHLLVANGGIPTRPETGRMKRDMERMDSSLARLDAATGELLGQWRLADRRLSLRHLAWNGAILGIALQAEHDDAQAKARAPVLALFDGHALHAVAAPEPLAGYGGSIVPLGAGFAVSCPRRQGVAIYGGEGFQTLVDLPEACPLALTQGRLWAGGLGHALAMASDANPNIDTRLPDIRLDNHWVAL